MTIFETINDIRETGIIGPRCREGFMPLLQAGPLSKIGVTAAGVSDLIGSYLMHRPKSNLTAIVGTLKGKGLLTTDDGQKILKPGDLLVAPKGINHRYELIDGKYWKVVCFNIKDEIPFTKVKVIKADYLESLAKDFLDVTSESLANSFLSIEARMGKENYLAAMLQRIIHYEKRGHEVLHERQLQILWNTVMKDLSRKWRRPELARIAGCSPEHLNRICNQRYGVPAMNYLTRLRMQHAAHLIGQGTHKILKIAGLCGYDNAFAFSVAFKRNYGKSPRNFLG